MGPGSLSSVNAFAAVVRRIDAYQRRHRVLAFPAAVVKKFGDDRAGRHAALIAYYGFFSLFPLLLVFVTILGFVLRDNPSVQAEILSSTLANFPIIGDQIRDNIGSLSGSGVALIAGLATALWAGLGVVRIFQSSMDEVWGVPQERRPNMIASVLRSAAMLAFLGAAAVASAVIGSLATAAGSSPPVRIGSVALTLVLDFGLFLFAFRMLTFADVSWRDVMPGAAVAAVAWTILHAAGGWYLGNRLQGATQIYGFFAIVIGLLAWITIAAQATLLAAEVNVVRVKRLWPRSLVASGEPPAADPAVRPFRKTG